MENHSEFEEESRLGKYPPPVVLALLVVVLLFSLMIGGGLLLMLGNALGMDMTDMAANAADLKTVAERNALRLIAGLNQLFTFLVPALVLAVLLFRRKAGEYLQLNRKPSLRQVGLGMLFMLAVFPLAQVLYQWNRQLPLPEWMIQQEDSINELIQALLVAEGSTELFFNLILIGLIPALGEELLFRGIIQKELGRWLRSGAAAVWIAAVIFSAVHLQFQGFFPRLLLGAALGYLLYWTGNLWVPILAHLANNGLQVLVQYFTKVDVSQMNPEEAEPIPWWLVLSSVLLMLGVGMDFARKRREKKDGEISEHVDQV